MRCPLLGCYSFSGRQTRDSIMASGTSALARCWAASKRRDSEASSSRQIWRYSFRSPLHPALLPLLRAIATWSKTARSSWMGDAGWKSGKKVGKVWASCCGCRCGFLSSASVASVPGARPVDLNSRAAWLSSPISINRFARARRAARS